MHERPVLVMAMSSPGARCGAAVEILPRLLERGSPRCVASRDRAAQRQAFEFDAGMRHVAQVGQRQRTHSKSALILDDDQPVGDEPRQRLPHRDRADRELLCERADQKLFARLIAAGRGRRPATEHRPPTRASADRPRSPSNGLRKIRKSGERRLSIIGDVIRESGPESSIIEYIFFMDAPRIAVTTLVMARCGLSLDNADHLRCARSGLVATLG